MAHVVLAVICASAAAYQLWRVPRVWAFLLLFIVLMPKVPLAAVPGSPTPIRIDDVVVAVVLARWAWRELFSTKQHDIPASPATLFLFLYWSAGLVSTLLGIAAQTTMPLTGLLHAARMIEYGMLYYFFYRTIRPEELKDLVRVLRFAILLVCFIWVAQHWTHTSVSSRLGNWHTLYPTFSATYDFGGFLMIATVVLYALWTTGGSRTAWTTVALVSCLYVTANSDSRGALLSVWVALVLDFVVHRRWRMALAVVAFGAAAPYLISSQKMMGLVRTLVTLVTSLDFDVVQRAFVTDPSLALRLRNWRLAIEHWFARPLLGNGLGSYLRYTRQYDLPASPDGWYVRVLADTGLVGLVTFLLLMAALLWILFAAFQRETQPIRRAIVYGSGLTVVATSVDAMLLDTFVSYKIMSVYWMIVAIGTRVAAETSTVDAGVQTLEPVQHPA